MKYQDRIDYPLDAARVMDFFTSPAFFLEKYRRQGASNVRLEDSTHTAEHFSVTISRDVPVEVEVPAFARSRIPRAITLVQTDSWDLRSRTGTLAIEFKGLPVKLTCRMRLEDAPGGARESLDFDIRVNLPLIGGKLEELLARDLQLKAGRDTEVTLELMAVATS